MNQFPQYIRYLDLFGSKVELKNVDGQYLYRSYFGGLLTLTMCALSIMYTIYIFVQWSNGNILPKITSYQKGIDSLILNLDDQFMHFRFYLIQDKPFSQYNNKLMPLLLIQNEHNQFDTIIPFFTNESNLSLSNITLVLSPNQSEYRSAIFLISPCTNKFNLGQTCAKQEEIDQYISNFNQFINIDVNLTYFNQHSDHLEQITKDTVIGISPNQTLFQSINLRTTFLSHDKGWLFENNEQNTFVENVEQVSQVINKKLTQQVLNNHDPIFLTLIRIDEIQTITKIVNTKISEILAQIGSIASLLMSINIFASFYNTHMLENQLLDKILSHLFPKLRSLFIRKNKFGKIYNIYFKGKEIDKQEFIIKYEQAKKMAIDYLNISNLINKIITIEKILNIQEDFRHFEQKPSNQRYNQVGEQEQQILELNQGGSSEVSMFFSN